MKYCFECNEPSDHEHHVIPKVYGGTKTVPLCERCHGKVHDRKFTNHQQMTMQGLAAAKARGTKLGTNGAKLARKNKRAANAFARALKDDLQRCIDKGMTRADIAAHFNATGKPTARGGKWHQTTVQNLAARIKALPTV